MVKHLHILLLEDNPLDAEIIRWLLLKHVPKHKLLWVKNKKEYLKALDQFGPEIILSDNSLPDFNARAALKLLHQSSLSIPFILITGTVSEEYAARIIKMGASDYILKDRLTRLPAAIKAALKQYEAEKEKIKAEKQKEFDNNNLKALINNTLDLMWSVDRNFNLITLNDSFNSSASLFSRKSPTKGKPVLNAQFKNHHAKRFKPFYERAFAGESFTITDHYTEDSFESWSEISFNPIWIAGKVTGTACFSRDITERKKAEATLERLSQENLRNKVEEQKKIARAILFTQEKERNAIGLELHDNVNQILVGTNLTLSMAQSNPESTVKLIDLSMNYLRQAIEENRKIAHKFVSPDLKAETLVEQLTQLTTNMLGTQNIKVKINTSKFLEPLLDPELKFHTYRIAQEQCTNIVKYAKAKKVNITLANTGKSFTMKIADDGIGKETKKSTAGVGIRNIKQRLSLYNGTVNIHTSPGNGFSLEISIPLN